VTLHLYTSVKYLKGVGPKRAEALARLGIRTVGDLLYHAPHRYLDATTVTPLAQAHVGQDVTCVGRVASTGVLPTHKGLRVFRAVLRDDAAGLLECAWPGQPFLERQIKKGQLLLVTGPVRYYHGRQLVPREFVILADEGDAGPERGLVLPVYPATEGLTHRQIRGLIHQHLDALLPLVHDPHPRALRDAADVPELRTALGAVHRPAAAADAEAGRRRLAFDELFDQQLVHARARALAKRARAGIRFALKKELTTRLKEHLPFELTADQRHAIREIADDMTAPLRMHRLLMGDVGTGKTVVALFAMLLALENEYQAVIMAPTELLAEQHVATLTRLLAPLELRPDLLIGRLSPAEKAAARERIATGASRLIVGTHALIQEAVKFRRLGLAVIDEQHRFGVEQRAALVEKGDAPDVLLLTATPIPRSLALTWYGDLDVTELRERPPGWGTVKTALRTEPARPKIYEFIRAECAAGRQAYVLYPVIDESEKADLKAATVMAGRIAKVFPELVIGLVHGRLKAEERDATMRAFRDNTRDRGGDRRRERDGDADRARRAVRAGAAAPAAGQGGPGRGGEPLHSPVRRARGGAAARGVRADDRRVQDRRARSRAAGNGRVDRGAPVGRGAAALRQFRHRPAATRGRAPGGGGDHRARPGAGAAGARGVSGADRGAIRAGV